MKNLLMLFIAIALISTSYAQVQKSNFRIAYAISIPTGDFADHIGSTSFRGASLEYNYLIMPRLEIGLESGWNLFYEKQDEKVYTEGTASISGIQYRYTNTIPIIAGAKFILGHDANLKPYGGLGIGTLYVNRYTDFGLYRLTTNTWQLAVRPELGLRYDYEHNKALFAAVKYYVADSNDELTGQSYVSLNIGIIF
jgi:hypothetical protein